MNDERFRAYFKIRSGGATVRIGDKSINGTVVRLPERDAYQLRDALSDCLDRYEEHLIRQRQTQGAARGTNDGGNQVRLA